MCILLLSVVHCLLLLVNFRRFILILFSVSPESVLLVGLCLTVCCASLVFPIVFMLFPKSLYYSSVYWTIYFTFSLALIFVFLILSSIVILRNTLKNFVCATWNFHVLICFRTHFWLPYFRAALDVMLRNLS